MISGLLPDTKQKLNKVYMLLADDINAKDLISKLLNVHPDNRPTISEVKKHAFFDGIKWERIKNQDHTPYYIPKLDHNFDSKFFSLINYLAKYFDYTNCKNKAFYISVKDLTEESENEELAEKQKNTLNEHIRLDMKNDKYEQK